MTPEEIQLAGVLVKTKGPDGKKTPYREVAAQFRIHCETLGRKFREQGIYRQPPPKVKQGPVPGNERAFYEGMILAGYSVEMVHWGCPPHALSFIKVGTESKNHIRGDLLKISLGRWGEVHQLTCSTEVYLHDPTFAFLMDPLTVINRERYLKSGKFSPLLLAVLGTRLSEKEKRVALGIRNYSKQVRNEVLSQLFHGFEQRYKFRMGGLNYRGDNGTNFIMLRDPDKVLGALISARNVRDLPFFEDLKALQNAQDTHPAFGVNQELDLSHNVFLEDLKEVEANYQRVRKLGAALLEDKYGLQFHSGSGID